MINVIRSHIHLTRPLVLKPRLLPYHEKFLGAILCPRIVLRFLYFVVPLSMMEFAAPRLILSVDYADANNLLAGVMNLKGFKVFKSKSNDDCLSIINQIEDKTDVVLIDKQSAVENDFFLVNQIRKMTPDTMIVIIADSAEEDEKLLEKNIDELVRRPISPENLADTIFTMLAKRELKRLREAG
jgi:PleD family two-component response regulator